jgi:predicted nucleic acid-binding protein
VTPVGFDNTLLSLLLNPNSKAPIDPDTGRPVEAARRRAEFLVATLGRSRRSIVIPTPVCAELLTAIGPDARQYIDIIAKSRVFTIAPFDSRCAIELAILNRTVFAPFDPKNQAEAYQKVKIDRQIIAIFKVAGVEDIYTDDGGLAKRARLCGLNPIPTVRLALPAEDRQMRMAFEPPDGIPGPDTIPDDTDGGLTPA